MLDNFLGQEQNILILLSTYNGEEYLEQQLDSLFNQTCQNFIIIARDDCSSDNTLQILKKYNIKILEANKNLGAKASFSELLKYAIHDSAVEYLMFCDQDDVWEKDKIEKTLLKMQEVEKLNSELPVLIHTDLKVVDSELNILNNSFWNYEQIDPTINSFNRLLTQNTITGCTIMVNRRLTELANPIPFEAIMHDSWLGLVASYFGKISVINESTILYRQHNLNSVGTKGFGIRYILDKLLKKNFAKRNSIQAKAFLDSYRDKLDKNSIQMLEDFSTIESKSFLQKRKILFKQKLFKQGFIRNVGLFLKI